jgi:beta-lactamase class A
MSASKLPPLLLLAAATLSSAALGCRSTGAAPVAPAAQAAPSGSATPSAPRELPTEAELSAAAKGAGGAVGVAVVHVETGASVSLRGRERFPMASVFKLPLSVVLQRRVEAGELDLSTRVTITAADLAPGFSPMAADLPAGGLTLTMSELVERVLVVGDNTVADVLLARAGGPASTTASLLSLDLPGIDISRGERQLALDFFGLARWPEVDALPNDALNAALKGASPDALRAAGLRFVADPRDTATPEAMARLLARLQRGELLGPAGTARLLAHMQSTKTGQKRLRGLLPPGTPVAHRTGTTDSFDGVTAATNDVGLVTLPDGTHLAVAVFVRASPRDSDAREGAIARIAPVAYDAAMHVSTRP